MSHLNSRGEVNMVNVAHKPVTLRTAKAKAVVVFPDEVFEKLASHEFHLPKGPLLQTAVLAGIMAAKRTGELIPLCHPIGLDSVNVEMQIQPNEIHVFCNTTITAKTGVEMEALTGAAIAALTIYDMCKALSHDICIRDIQLIEKKGGKHDFSRQA